MDDLLREFVGETLEMVEALADDLVAWESRPDDYALLNRIFRTIHTVKGSSAFFELPRITAIAHAAENVLDSARTGATLVTHDAVSVILDCFVRIRLLTGLIAESGCEPVGDDDELLITLTAAFAGSTSAVSRNLTAETPKMPTDGQAIPQAWRSLRVPLVLLDEVVSGVSDMVLARNEVAAQLRLQNIDPSDIPAFSRLTGLLTSTRASIGRMRMVPVRHLFSPLPRLARQLADALGKEVHLMIDDGEVEIDREVIEALRDPLVHIVRNAIDHGIETAQDRKSAGKAATGTLRITAAQEGNRIIIAVEDDGRGLVLDAIAARAVEAGHITQASVETMTDDTKAQLIFVPGLTTAPALTGISGRGVGMDVVKANVEQLGGVLSVMAAHPFGTRLVIDVPMTMTVIAALGINIAGQSFAIPRSIVEEVLLASSDTVECHRSGGGALVTVRGRTLPLLVVEQALGFAREVQQPEDDRALILCRVGRGRTLVLDVPDVRDHEELVIKPLAPAVAALGMYAGVTLPDNGKPMLVLDVCGLAERIIGAIDSAEFDAGHSLDPKVPAPQVSDYWLHFTPWGLGTQAAVPMAYVLRIWDIPRALIHSAAGRLVAQCDGELVIVDPADFNPESSDAVRMIRVGDDASSILIPVRDVGSLIELSATLVGDPAATRICGITQYQGRVIEMVNVPALLSEVIDGSISENMTPVLPRWVVPEDER